MKNMPSHSVLIYAFFYIAIFLTSPIVPNIFASAYVINSSNAISAHSLPHPTSALASKVIYESPSMGNIYKEFLVTSKPVVLRKYGHGKKKTKKTKKDSKIYFIPIPPMPYRFIPGVGYDYQPVKINPIMLEGPTTNAPDHAKKPSIKVGYNQYPQQQTHPIKEMHAQKKQDHAPETTMRTTTTITTTTTTESPKDSKIIRMDMNNRRFNGRPLRLQVAHALRKHRLAPHNLKSKFYLNKKIIY